MTLLVGYEGFRDPEPSIKAGQRFRDIGEVGTMPVGPAHAVKEGENRALCGTHVIVTDKPWPPVIGDRCWTCRKALRTAS